MFVDQQNRYTSLDKCLKIDFFKKNDFMFTMAKPHRSITTVQTTEKMKYF